MSLPTIKQNLNVLEKENLIYYEGNFDSTGGRKAQVISVNPKAAFSVCVNLFDKGFNVSLVNLKGELVQAKTYEKHFDDSKQYAECVAKCIDDVISANGVHKDKVLGVGITVPGIFDKTNTIVRTSLTMNLKDYPISNITDYISYPCIAMNDARSGAYAEFWNEMCIKGREVITHTGLRSGGNKKTEYTSP